MAEIKYLKDYPQYLPIVAYWNYKEWHFGELPFDDIIRRYQQRLQGAAVPTTLIAVEDTMPVGSVSLKLDDLPERLDLNPWLASLLVTADYRGRGIGRMLLLAAEAAAKDAGVTRLYLYTHTANALYEKEGWKFFDKVEKKGVYESIYYKDL